MNVPAQSFEDLIVWQKAHQFVLAIYALTESFPRSELFVLTSQMRRAGISIPSNIAEGFKKRSTKEKVHLLNVAQASLEESQYYLILTQRPPVRRYRPTQTKSRRNKPDARVLRQRDRTQSRSLLDPSSLSLAPPLSRS